MHPEIEWLQEWKLFLHVFIYRNVFLKSYSKNQRPEKLKFTGTISDIVRK
jgi:hypothetical protein